LALREVSSIADEVFAKSGRISSLTKANASFHSRKLEGNTMKKLLFGVLAVFAATASAELYKCSANGKTVYSQTRCAQDAETIQVTPPPTDSLDNPGAAMRYQAMKAMEESNRLEQQRLQFEQQRLQADRLAQQEQLKMQQELIDRAQGIGLGATFGLRPNGNQALQQQTAMKALRAINGVPEAPTVVVPPPVLHNTNCAPNAIGTSVDCN
jgi:hypothetical protein